MSDAVQCETKV